MMYRRETSVSSRRRALSQERRPPTEAASITRDTALVLLLTFNGISAERRILFANFERFLIGGALVPGIHCVEAVPSLNRNALWRRACECSYRFCPGCRSSPYEAKACAGRFDGCLCLRGDIFSVSLGIRHVDFSDEIQLRFCL